MPVSMNTTAASSIAPGEVIYQERVVYRETENKENKELE